MPVSRPTQAEIDTVVDRLLQAISDGNQEPFSILGELADRRLLVDLCATDMIEADLIVDRLRAMARSLGWTQRAIAGISLRRFERAARRQLSEEEVQRRTVEQGMQAERRTGTRRRQRQSMLGAGLDAQQLIDQDSSLFLIAVGQLLAAWQGHLWFDTFHMKALMDRRPTVEGTVECPTKPMDDATELAICAWLHAVDPRLGRVGFQTLQRAIQHVAYLDRRNEPRDWLHSLQWDREKRLTRLLPEGFGTKDSEYHQEVGRAWMVSMVARIMEPGCKVDTVPVLVGGEGVFKSQAMEVIGGKYYRAALGNIGEKDFLMQMWGCVLFDIPELHSMASGTRSGELLKASITNSTDHFRAPYGRLAQDHPRHCVWTGSSNREDWFGDTGPGRRFWPYRVGLVKLDWIREHRDQLWAEALACWQLGSDEHDGCWWNVPDEERLQEIERSRHVSEFEQRVQLWLSSGVAIYDGLNGTPAIAPVRRAGTNGSAAIMHWGTLVTVDRIAEEALGMTPEMLARSRNDLKISSALRGLGWTRERRRVAGRDYNVRFWVRATPLDMQIEEPVLRESEMPF